MKTANMEITSPAKAIRAFCLGCVGYSANEVKLCPSVKCPLHPFRFGKNPYLKRELTEEQRQASAARLAAMREKASLKRNSEQNTFIEEESP